jgi:hypothetical protein
MNRQALPSIFLSVSTVCFFAIALFQRHGEPRRLPQKSGPAKSDGIRTQAPIRSGALSQDTAGEVIKAPIRGTSPDQVGSAPPVQRGGGRSKMAKANRPDVQTQADSTASRGRVIADPAPAVQVASNRAAHGGASPPPLQRLASQSAPESARRLARAPFTVVGSGETMADVARRVYGTADDVESLWRANRDIPREPGSALAPGTVLHTPAPPSR